jgi:hypothetical protein
VARSVPRTVSRGPLRGRRFSTRAAYERALSAVRGFATRTGFRVARAAGLPVSRSQAYGKPRPGEPSIRAVRSAQRTGFPMPPPRGGLGPMQVVTTDGGRTTLTPRNTAGRALVFAYHDAVRHYVESGDDSKLRALRGRTLRGRVLETDPDVLEALGRRGALDDFTPYA